MGLEAISPASKHHRSPTNKQASGAKSIIKALACQWAGLSSSIQHLNVNLVDV
jgi:hypothetical protein